MKTRKQYIASFLLILFSFMQIVDLHKLNHDQGEVDCSICCLISEDLHDDHFFPEDLISVPLEISLLSNEQVSNYTSPIVSEHRNTNFLNKAPPVTV